MDAESAASTQDFPLPEEFSDRENRPIEYFARAMHALTSGDWRAAGGAITAKPAATRKLDILPQNARGHRG